MGDMSTNFSRYEFACKCGCGGDTMDAATLEAGEAIREHFNARVTVTSAYRCFEYNRIPVSEGGPGSNDASQHPRGRAMDIVVEGIPASRVAEYAETVLLLGGVGRYNTFTHIDTRTNGPARW